MRFGVVKQFGHGSSRRVKGGVAGGRKAVMNSPGNLEQPSVLTVDLLDTDEKAGVELRPFVHDASSQNNSAAGLLRAVVPADSRSCRPG
jgi:hypothetical protein